MLALALGVTVMFEEAAPTAERCLARLQDSGVTNLAATPTLLRSLMALGAEAVARYRVRVRAATCCGEPLNAEVVTFFRARWGVTVMDHYGSSEPGLPVGNCNAIDMEVKPGSMGRPLPGSTVAIVDDEGHEVPPDVVGHVGIEPHPEGYYSLGYWGDPDRTRALYRGPWMTAATSRAGMPTGTSGSRGAPTSHQERGLPHWPLRGGERAPAAPRGGRGRGGGCARRAPRPHREGLRRAQGAPGPLPRPGGQLVYVVRTRVGHHQYPRAIAFLDELPKTETGKIQRFLLRQRA